MSKLNKKNTAYKAPVKVGKQNHGLSRSGNGNLQYNKSAEMALFEVVVSTLYGVDKYYERSHDAVDRMRVALKTVLANRGAEGAAFACRVARFAREHMNIRTMPIVMMVELAKLNRDMGIEAPLRSAVSQVISRVDELTDLYAYALTVFGSKQAVPLSLKKGVADAFNKFDAYQFAKYNRSEGLKLRDLLRIVHPKPADMVRAEIFNKIKNESLEAAATWEVELTRNGQLHKAEQRSKADLWTDLVTREGSGSLGYMALLRNLRNMHEAGISADTWKHVAARISNKKAVEKSKQLPFAFINARAIAQEKRLPTVIVNALTDAVEHSLGNLPKLGENVWIILDTSGSMQSGMGINGANSPLKVGALFSAALFNASRDSYNVKISWFATSAGFMDLNTRDSIFSNYDRILRQCGGGGTNLEAAMNQKKSLGFEPDVVIVLSDMEVNQLSSRKATEIFGKDCVKIAINLNSRGNTPLSEINDWIQLSGWSEKIFQFVKFKRDSDSIVDTLLKGYPTPVKHTEPKVVKKAESEIPDDFDDEAW